MADERHIFAMDGLRGLAAYTVFIAHFLSVIGFIGKAGEWGGGHIGVMVFFALSGYLMGHLYFSTPATINNVGYFSRRRAARVLPLYLAIVFVSFALTCTFDNWRYYAYVIDYSNIADHLLMIRGVSVLWTVPIEIQFYLLFPLVWLSAAWAGLARTVIIMVLMIVGLLYAHTLDTPKHLSLLLVGHYFIAGILMACLPDFGTSRLWNAAFLLAIAATILLFPGVGNIIPMPAEGQRPGQMIQLMWGSPIYLATICALLLTASRAPIAHSILGNPLLTRLGAISYSLYLLHMPVIWYLRRFTNLRNDEFLFLIVGHIAVVAVAAASFYFFERPARNWINRFSLVPRSRMDPHLSR